MIQSLPNGIRHNIIHGGMRINHSHGYNNVNAHYSTMWKILENFQVGNILFDEYPYQGSSRLLENCSLMCILEPRYTTGGER